MLVESACIFLQPIIFSERLGVRSEKKRGNKNDCKNLGLRKFKNRIALSYDRWTS